MLARSSCAATATLALAGVLATSAPGASTARAATAAGACRLADRPVQAATVARARGATLCLLNRIRRRHRLAALRPNGRLRAAATAHSRAMVRRRFFAHGAYVSRIQHTGYLARAGSWSVGENIAWGAGPLATPRAIVAIWMHSPPHRENILSPVYREIGVGIAPGTPTAAGGATYTTDFGRRR
jgi:uncharacterized protein YkwD